MAVGALGGDAAFVLLNFRLAGFELFVLSAQEVKTIVLLFLEVVRYLAVAAVDARFRALLEVGRHVFKFDFESALAGNGAILTGLEMLEGLVVGQRREVLFILRVNVRARKLLLQQFLLGESVDRLEICVAAAERAILVVLQRALADPLFEACRTEGSLTLRALAWVQDHLEANLAHEELVQCTVILPVQAGRIARAQFNDILQLHIVRLFNKYKIARRNTRPVHLFILVQALAHVLEDSLR